MRDAVTLSQMRSALQPNVSSSEATLLSFNRKYYKSVLCILTVTINLDLLSFLTSKRCNLFIVTNLSTILRSYNIYACILLLHFSFSAYRPTQRSIRIYNL